MRFSISASLQADIFAAVGVANSQQGIVNVPVVAERVRCHNRHENVALEDIERRVLEIAQLFGAAIEFDRGPLLTDAIDVAILSRPAAIVTIEQE